MRDAPVKWVWPQDILSKLKNLEVKDSSRNLKKRHQLVFGVTRCEYCSKHNNTGKKFCSPKCYFDFQREHGGFFKPQKDESLRLLILRSIKMGCDSIRKLAKRYGHTDSWSWRLVKELEGKGLLARAPRTLVKNGERQLFLTPEGLSKLKQE